MKLRELKELSYTLLQGSDDVELRSISYNTKTLQEGDIFICLKGSKFDAHEHIEEIAKAKPSLVLVEREVGTAQPLNIIRVESTRQALALLSAALFDYPARKMCIIGVTGTKGKTTVTHMLKAMLEKSGAKTGMLGTNGIFIGEERIPSLNTTPESYELHRHFHRMWEAGCSYVVMEVSSQAVKMDRSYGIAFDYGIFTNISPDHIGEDEHKDFAEYLDCKIGFLKQCKLALINKDDPLAEDILNRSDAEANFTFGKDKKADFYFSRLKYLQKKNFVGISFVTGGLRDLEVQVGVPGLFNVYNALAAVAVGTFLKLDQGVLETALEDLRVDGRMEIVYSDENFTVIVDYAHNAVSMESLLKTLRDYRPKRLVVLFGCGGNRSKDRRYGMGESAAKLADLSIVTADNSRYERVEDITEDILSRMRPLQAEYVCIYDRAEAIAYAVEQAQKGDMIAIIGKGHEDYQEIAGQRHYFKDADEVAKAIERAKQKGKIHA